MAHLGTGLAVLLFVAACNLDTLILAMGYGVKGIRLSAGRRLVLSAVTTLVTWVSLVLGDIAALVLTARAGARLGGVVLVGIGLWFVLDWLRRAGGGGEPGGGAATLWECVCLAAALAVNNAGVGAAAGVSGLNPHWAALGNFLATLAALALGYRLGAGPAGRLLGKYALPLSGLLLILLGVWEMLG